MPGTESDASCPQGRLHMELNSLYREREFFIDNLLIRVHCIIVMIRWTGFAPWEFKFSFPGSFTCTFLEQPVPVVYVLFFGTNTDAVCA